VTPFNRLFQDPDIMRFWNPLTAAGRAALDDEITRQATVIAFIDDFKLMMITALVAIPLVFLLRRGRQAPAAQPVVAD
jgi:DHA2 family multidrug resistance protein